MGKPKAKAKRKAVKKALPVRKLARQSALPGMQDAKITAIENLAMDYAEIRDQRQELTKQESDLKQNLIKLMHKAGKTEYKRNGISVTLETEEETVKVRVREDGEIPAPKQSEQPESVSPEEQYEEKKEADEQVEEDEELPAGYDEEAEENEGEQTQP